MQRIAKGLLTAGYYVLIIGVLIAHTGANAGWSQGAAQYRQQYQAAYQQQQPLLVYFTAERYRAEHHRGGALNHPDARRLLAGIATVTVNPNHGPDARRLYQRYNAPSLPALYLVFPERGGSERRFNLRLPRGNNAIETRRAFIDQATAALLKHYSERGQRLNQQQHYLPARRALVRALRYNEHNVSVLYQLGQSYLGQGQARVNPELLRQARDCYLQALTVNPQHSPSRTGLRRVDALLASLSTAV